MDLSDVEETLRKIKDGTKPSSLEGQRLEFKACPKGNLNKKKLSQILEECAVAFANADGGFLVIGVEDKISGTGAFTGCTNYDIPEMKRIVYNHTRPSIMVEIREIQGEGATLLSVYVPQSPTIHSTSAGVVYRRVGKENRIVYPEDMTSLKVDKGHDYTEGFLQNADIEDIDLVEVARLRNWMGKYNPDNDFSQLSDKKLLEAIGLLKKSGDRLQPTVACLLLVGKEAILRDKLPQCETVFLRFDEDDTTPAKSSYMKSPLLKTIDKIWDMIEPYNTTVTIKDAFLETPVPSFPEEVVREGLLNALTHRDYSLNDAVYLKLYKNHIEL